MNYVEEALVFQFVGEQLLGIVTKPEVPCDCGVLILVGGPQYRVGSHRQFLLLARRLAVEGYPSLRLDYRGMGDSSGDMRGFEDTSNDIGAAINAFKLVCPEVERVVLWGLCDAASAALLYVHETQDASVSGLVLLNPWVRSEASLAQTRIKHYYGQRLMQREFWIKVLSGKMQLLRSVRGLFYSAMTARSKRVQATSERRSFQDRMADGFGQFRGSILLILSGQDYTAKEFMGFVRSNPAWSGLIKDPKVSRVDLEEADHTFSSRVLRLSVEGATLDWLVKFRGPKDRVSLRKHDICNLSGERK